MTRPSRKLKPETVICTYRIKKGRQAAFLKLRSGHWPTLRRLGLATKEPALIFRGTDKSEKPFIVEIFTWKSWKAVQAAHQSPEVMAVWEAMGKHTEARLGHPAMEFPHVEPVRLKFGKA